MPRWRLLLGGPLIWAAHFAALYAIASIAHVTTGGTGMWARAASVTISVLCLVVCLWVLTIAWKQPRGDALESFWRIVAMTGAILAAIAIVWQTLPVFAPIGGTALLSPS